MINLNRFLITCSIVIGLFTGTVILILEAIEYETKMGLIQCKQLDDDWYLFRSNHVVKGKSSWITNDAGKVGITFTKKSVDK